MSLPRIRPVLVPLAILMLVAGCSTVSTPGGGGATGQRLNPNHPDLAARHAQIAAEPRGDYYIGRRYYIEGTRFWGFVRRPGQPWEEAKLVMLGEKSKKAPDRLPEHGGGTRVHGFDHNHEYKLTGYFSGDRVYDPNSNQVLPEFVLRDYELISARPGFLFHPQQRFEPNRIPAPPRS